MLIGARRAAADERRAVSISGGDDESGGAGTRGAAVVCALASVGRTFSEAAGRRSRTLPPRSLM